MHRLPKKPALSLLLCTGLVLSAGPAQGGVETIRQGSHVTTRTETRLVPTTETEEVAGTREVTKVTLSTEERIIDHRSTLFLDWETSSYRTPVTTYPLQREEKRTVTTTTTNFLRRNTEEVVQKVDKRYLLGGNLKREDWIPMFTPLSTLDVRLLAWPTDTLLDTLYRIKFGDQAHLENPVLTPLASKQEIDEQKWAQGNSLLIHHKPSGHAISDTNAQYEAYLVFDKDLKFHGGLMVIAEQTMGQPGWREIFHISQAAIVREAGRDTIVYVQDTRVYNPHETYKLPQAGLPIGYKVSPEGVVEDSSVFKPFSYPQVHAVRESGRTVAYVNIDAPRYVNLPCTDQLITLRENPQKQLVTTETPYTEVSESAGPWEASGKLVRSGEGKLRYVTSTGQVCLATRMVVKKPKSAKSLASAGPDTRRIFTGDSGSGKNRAALSTAQVRQKLGADKVNATRPTSRNSVGAPAQGPLDNGLNLDALLKTVGQSPAPTPAPSEPPKRVSEKPAPEGEQVATGTVQEAQLKQAWLFPQNPQHSPMRWRYEAYRRATI